MRLDRWLSNVDCADTFIRTCRGIEMSIWKSHGLLLINNNQKENKKTVSVIVRFRILFLFFMVLAFLSNNCGAFRLGINSCVEVASTQWHCWDPTCWSNQTVCSWFSSFREHAVSWVRSLVLFKCRTRAANRGGAPQASYDKCRHRNYFQTRPLQAFPKKVNILWGQRSLWCDQTRVELHRSTCLASRILTQKEPFLRSKFTAAQNLDMLNAGQSPNADSPPRDHLITMAKLKKKTYKSSFEKWKNLNILGDLWERMMNMLSTTHVRMAVWELKTWRRQRLDDWKFARGVFPSEYPQKHTVCTDLLCRSGEGRGRLKIVCGAPRPMAWWGNKCLLSRTIDNFDSLWKVLHQLKPRASTAWCN